MAMAGTFTTNGSDSFHQMLKNYAEASKSLTNKLESSEFGM